MARAEQTLMTSGELHLPVISQNLREQLQGIEGVVSVDAYECFWSGCSTWDKAKVKYAKNTSPETKELIKARMVVLGWTFNEDSVGMLIFSSGL